MMKLARVAVLLVAAVNVIGCSPNDYQAISANIANGATTLDLASLTSTNWDRLYIFPPYSSENMVTTSLQRTWSSYKQTRIGDDECSSLLVFTYDGEVREWWMHPRTKGDFASIFRTNGYAREEAHFWVERSADGRATILKDSEPHLGAHESTRTTK